MFYKNNNGDWFLQINNIMIKKYEILKEYLKQLVSEGICVAFSGGVDSSVLLKIACDEAQKINKQIYAITFDTCLHPSSDVEYAKSLCRDFGAIHEVVKINEFDDPYIKHNPVDRCYRCKKLLFASAQNFAAERNIKNVIDGTNFDDLKEYRPGIKALNELNIISPLAEKEITKAEIREIADYLNIKSAKKPSAPCLATRLPYDTIIDYDTLRRIEQGEEMMKSLGFDVIRLRLHGDIVRIEIKKEMFQKFFEQSENIVINLKKLGFIYIVLDMEGFRSGSMDIKIKKIKKIEGAI